MNCKSLPRRCSSQNSPHKVYRSIDCASRPPGSRPTRFKSDLRIDYISFFPYLSTRRRWGGVSGHSADFLSNPIIFEPWDNSEPCSMESLSAVRLFGEASIGRHAQSRRRNDIQHGQDNATILPSYLHWHSLGNVPLWIVWPCSSCGGAIVQI